MSPIEMVMHSRATLGNVFHEESSTKSIAIRISYFLLQQLDVILTVWAVNAGFMELNPIMRTMLASPVQLIALKVFIPALLAWFLPSKLLLPSLVLIMSITAWNLKELVFLVV
jgi:hypothetical protein